MGYDDIDLTVLVAVMEIFGDSGGVIIIAMTIVMITVTLEVMVTMHR